MRVTLVLAGLAVVLAGASLAFAADPGASASAEPVPFSDTLTTGLAGVDVQQAHAAGHEIPRVEVFYSHYQYVVGYYGVASAVTAVDREETTRQFGRPIGIYVSDYSGAGPRLTDEGYLTVTSDPAVGWTRASEASFVVGSGARTPGSPAVVPFSDAADASDFAERYGPGELPYHVEIGGLDVLGVNSAGSADRLFETHEGRVEEATLSWLDDALEASTNPLVLVHHNLPPVSDQIAAHREIEPEMVAVPGMSEATAFAETLAAGGAGLVVTGHYHLPATGLSHGVREIAAPTTCSFPQSYLLCETTPDGTTIRLVPVADEVGLESAHARRTADSATARGLTAIAASRLASFPLVSE